MDAKRSLGQNFFVNKSLAEKIVGFALENNPETIIEIGPGTGSFTQLFNITDKKVCAVEKDDLLFTSLQLAFPKIKFTHSDFLEVNLNDFALKNGIDYSKTVFYGSLPYNLSKKIIEKCLSETKALGYYFIIQKEVAEKYCQIEPHNNPISIFAHLHTTPKKIIDIKPDSFTPRPNVMSSLIRFLPTHPEQSAILVRSIDYRRFMKFVHMCFTQPRKTLNNNLKQLLKNSKKMPTPETLARRPENLSTQEFIELYTTLY